MLPRPEQNRVQIRFPLTTTYEQSSDPARYLAVRSETTDQVLQARPRQFDPAAHRFDRMDTLTLMDVASQGGGAQAAILLHERFALPLACWILPLAGMPLAISSSRAGTILGRPASDAAVLRVLDAIARRGRPRRAVRAAADSRCVVRQSRVRTPWIAALPPNRFPARGERPAPTGHMAGASGAAVAPESRMVPRQPKRFERQVAAGPDPSARAGGRPLCAPEVPLLPDRVADRVRLWIWYVFTFFELLNDMLGRDRLGRFIPYLYYLTPFWFTTRPL